MTDKDGQYNFDISDPAPSWATLTFHRLGYEARSSAELKGHFEPIRLSTSSSRLPPREAAQGQSARSAPRSKWLAHSFAARAMITA